MTLLSSIGNKKRRQKKVAYIGNNVRIGAHSIIFGDITIGNNIIIGAGTLVNKDISENSFAIGNPARIFPLK